MTFYLTQTGTPVFHIEPEQYDRYRALGSWATGEIGKLPGVVLDGLAIVDDAKNGRPVEPWTSESFDVKIDSSGITFQNFFSDRERGRYTLDELRDVLEEYWRFLAAIPEPEGGYRAYWPELPRPEAEVLLWEKVWKRPHPYRGRLF
jgi:hypothetical protein